MVAVLGANSVSGGYEVSNSLRFNSGDSPQLSRTPDAGNRRTFTLSFWVKRGNISVSASPTIISSGIDSSNDTRFLITDQDIFLVRGMESGGSVMNLQSSAKFRDPSAWYHFVMAVDTTQSTASDRVKIYVNGVQNTSFGTEDYPTQNRDLFFNHSSSTEKIGVLSYSGANYWDGYMTEFQSVDGSQLLPTSFGEFDDNGVWIPKKYTGSYGTNGFFLQFKQTGTSQNSSGIGSDTSGNDNHFTPTNLAATDITEDTCTNNFATMNPLAAFENDGTTYFNGNYTMAEGNLQMVSSSTTGNWGHSFSTIGVSSGKWYWENRVNSISNSTHSGVSQLFTSGYFQNQSTSKNINLINGNSNSGNYNIGSAFSSGDILIVALDMDNGEVYFGKNGTWGNSGNPATNTNPCFTGLDTTTEYFAGFDIAYAGSFSWNFGNPDFAISSGNNDGKYGNFEYAPPSGYYALCTKRLAEFG
jgi:hypothetical protein